MSYRLNLFGTFSLTDPKGREVPIVSARARALLAYLALPPGTRRSREKITALLWSDRGEAQGRASLRQVLTGLRKVLGAEGRDLLLTNGNWVALDADAVILAPPNGLDFLDGLSIRDPAFDEWLRDERLRLETPAPSPNAIPPETPAAPSIAVLPFSDLSPDPAHRHFADGMTQDIITALAKIPKLFVIAAESTAAYKDRAVGMDQVGREQGVRYVLHGSIRREEDRLRISARLVEAATGHVLWAQRYDRIVAGLFDLQDDITREVVSALQVELAEGDQARLWASGTRNHEAWECVIQIPALFSGHRREDILEGARLAERAVALDNGYATAWVFLAWAYVDKVFNGWTEDRDATLDKAMVAATRARDIDPGNPDAHTLLAFTELCRRNFDAAKRHAETAMELGPNNAFAFGVAANVGQYRNEPEYMIPLQKKAMRLSPIYPAWHPETLGWAHLLLRRHHDAIALAEEAVGIDPDYIYSYIVLAVAHAETGDLDKARDAVGHVERIFPGYSLAIFAKTQPFRDEAVLKRHLDALRRAGLQE
jgi:TolB-like protein